MTQTKTKTVNMTEGSPLRLLVSFSIPMLIGNLFQQVYNLVDSIVVGQFLGPNALASVGATTSVSFFFIAMCNGLSSGGGVITAQAFGRDDTKDVKKSITNTAYVMFVIPLLIGVIAFFLAGPMLRALDTPEEILKDALYYLRSMCVGIVFVAIYNYGSAMLRSLGDSKTPLYFLIFSCLLNTGLDVLFVYSFHMGVLGAGVATVIAQCVSGVVCLLYALKTNPYFQFEKGDLMVDWGLIRKVLKLGIPFSLQFSLIAISCMALQKVVNSFGNVAVASFTATSRIEQMIHQPYQTLSAALATFCGQNFGAKKMDRVKKGYRIGLLLMAIFSVLMLPAMQFGGKAIMRIFVDDAPVIEMGAKALSITSLFYIFLGTIYIIRGVLNGMGDAFFALMNGVVEVIGRFAVPLPLTKIPSVGLWGIWWSVGIVWFFSGVTAWMRYVQYSRRKDLL